MSGIKFLETVAEARRVTKSISRWLATASLDLKKIQKSLNREILVAGPITTRGPASGSDGSIKSRSLSKNTIGNISKLTKLLDEQQERLQVAQHIAALIKHHFDKSDSLTLRLAKTVNQLVIDCTKLVKETSNSLASIAKDSASDGYRQQVLKIANSIKKWFAGKYKNITLNYSVAIKNNPDSKLPIIHNIGYITLNDLNSGTTTQDYVVVVVQQIEEGKEQLFVRTLTDYRPPNWIIKHNLGTKFDSPNKALSIVYHTMQMENMLDAAAPAGIPVKKNILKFDNDKIYKVNADDNTGRVSVYLKPEVQESSVAAVASDLFVQLKSIIKTVHPRFKNPIRMMQPRKARLRNKDKTFDSWVVTFAFTKPQPDEVKNGGIEISRDKVKQFMDFFKIDDPEEVKDFNKLLRNFLGVR